MNSQDSEFISVSEMASILGIERTTLYKAVKRGEVPSVRIGGRVLIHRHVLDQMRHMAGAVPDSGAN